MIGNGRNQIAQPIAIAGPQSKAIFLWPYKYVRDTARGRTTTTTTTTALYNVVADPTETTDITAKYRKIAKQLAAQLKQYDGIESLAETGPRPGSLFQHNDGSNNYRLRLPETRSPWAAKADSQSAGEGAVRSRRTQKWAKHSP
jgi:hypothetical protein